MNSSKKTAMYFMYIVDVVTLIISFCMAYLVKFNWIEGENNIHRSDYIILFLLISIMYILINLIFMKNIDFINRNITKEVIETVKTIVYIAVLVMVVLFFLKNSANYSRSMMLIFIVVSCPVMLMGRLVLKRILRVAYASDRYQERVVVISDSWHIEETMSGLKNDDNYKIVGIVLTDSNQIGDDYYGVDVIADKDTYIQAIEEREADSVLLSANDVDEQLCSEIISTLQSIGKNVHVRLREYELCDGYKQFKKIGSWATISYMSSKNMMFYQVQKRKLTIKPGLIGEWSFRPKEYEQIAATSESYDMPYDKSMKGDIKRFVMAMGRCVVYHPKHIMKQLEIDEQIGAISEILENKIPYQYDESVYKVEKTFGRHIYLIIKRTFDVVLSAIGLIILSPVFLIIMICVIAEDGSNPFYGHIRIGKNGKKICVYKFRSMKNIDVDIEKILTPEQLLQYRTEFKIDNDPRITKVGNFLRKSSLDELPQLINILKGDISIVGPRPIVEREIEIYGKDKAKLLSVQPGLTGYWQAYARNNATYESGERQKMEMYYVEHQSLWLDIKIIFKTFSSVLKGSGAQ